MNRELLHEIHVDIAEHIMKWKFPASYREVLLGSKGKSLDTRWDFYPELVPFEPEPDSDAEYEKVVDDEFALLDFLMEMTKQAKKSWWELPENALVIAEDGCGDALVLLATDYNSDGDLEFEETFYVFDHSSFELFIEAESVEELAQIYKDIDEAYPDVQVAT